jgi:aspartyl-tRNA synthetase
LNKRTHNCGELNKTKINEKVNLMGWVNSFRQHGKLIFLDLRDRYGVTQVVFDESIDKVAYNIAKTVRNEYVVACQGIVRKRVQVNKNISTGEIEVLINELTILNKSKALPFQNIEGKDAESSLKLKYRYLDLRTKDLQKNLILRHKVSQIVRNYLSSLNYLEIETPILIKTTPEGARDFLVPSRVLKGNFYALPQSPQTLKQLLMIGGLDRYFQICRCFRDEDLRADRQPEFTQIDIENSFTKKEELFCEIEDLMKKIWKDALNVNIKTPFPLISYEQAMEYYGTDKPDLRFDLRLKNISNIFSCTDFNVFKTILKEKGIIKAIKIEDKASFSRKDLDDLNKIVTPFGFKGVAWLRYQDDWKGSIVKFVKESEKENLIKNLNLKKDDLIILLAGKESLVNAGLSDLRLYIGEKLNLIKKDEFNFVWVTDFPLLTYDENEKRYYAMHHPFTSPIEEDKDKLFEGKDLFSVKADAYDLVCNGVELGGGSQRIFDSNLQNKMFKALSIEEKEAKEKFGFFLEALNYGTPPHGGIAFGLDRLIMILSKTNSIREVIAFPKTQKSFDLMLNAPSKPDEGQLKELGLKLIK